MDCEQEAKALVLSRPDLASAVAKLMRRKRVGGLTAKQRELFDFIVRYADEHNRVTPSYDEMKDALGLVSKSGIHRLVTGLEERGHISRLPGYARSITIRGVDQ